MTLDILTSPEPALLQTRAWWGVGLQRATEDQWREAIGDLSPVQRMVHMAGRMTEGDLADLSDRLFAEARETYRRALEDEAAKFGCVVKALVPAAGPELRALRERADWAAESVVNTYNLSLVRALQDIAQEVPSANRHTYASRLFYAPDAWDAQYWTAKQVEIGQVETMTVINAAIDDFYQRNDLEMLEANVVPFVAACPICQDMIDGNPYPSPDAVYTRYVLPAHPGCVHRVEVVPADRLPIDACLNLWLGEGAELPLGAIGMEGASSSGEIGPGAGLSAEQAIAEMERISKAYDDRRLQLQRELIDLEERWAALDRRILDEDYASEEELDAIQRELDRLGRQIEVTGTAWRNSTRDERAAQRRALFRSRQADLTWSHKADVDPDFRLTDRQAATIDQAFEAFKYLLGDRVSSSRPIEFYREPEGRSFHSGGQVYLAARDGEKAVWHELGHWLEYRYRTVEQEAREFLEARTAGEEEVPLSSVSGLSGYRSGEMCRPDKFLDPYMGKSYDGATEIMSMGLQHLWQDPLGFAKQDREYFDFVVDQVRGLYY